MGIFTRKAVIRSIINLNFTVWLIIKGNDMLFFIYKILVRRGKEAKIVYIKR